MSAFIDLWAFLSLGFLIGMAHALEPDHLAAVGAMTDGRKTRRSLMLRGAFWGLGHTSALFLICTVVIALGATISGRAEATLELAVGVMIIALGLRVLWTLHRERIHFHVHEHHGAAHIHLHSHAKDPLPHKASPHDHAHKSGHAMTFGIGLLHGAAGSAGLLVLTVAATDSFAQGLAYIAVFGIGSLVGMAALTTIANYPLAMVERGAQWMKTATSLGIGALALWVGGTLAVHSFAAL